ncbi:DUF2971 domain-containing protein [Methanosarcina sp. UBA289]|uniref:DUF2971 domain-containing protein n=1 Tax=Methanosarcina sp. UBA289 TaxID=1915574 RepID=UPI0025D6A69B|nr:DUF2971 domain-containing protein [Methanosarcina sp. UBA289]
MQMYEKVETIESPENELTKIWRYMDFTKYVSILDTNSLFFADFRTFEDPIEGQFPNANRIQTMETLTKAFAGNSSMLEFLRKENPIDRSTKGLHGSGSFCICGWHENDYESAAMWKLYSDLEKGIAIQTTYKNLKECFFEAKPKVVIGKVEYLDYNEDSIPWGNELKIYKPFVYKRRSFEYEHEIRAIVFVPSGEKKEKTSGIYVPVSLDTLIEKVYVSPKSPKWFLNLVKSVSKKYRLNKEVIQSDLYNGLI